MVQRPVHGAFRAFLIVLVALILTLPHWLVSKMYTPLGMKIGRFYLRVWTRAVGHKVRVEGKVSPEVPMVFVANHASYMDILMCHFIEARFVAKEEVKSWPLIGMMATWQKTIYISRARTAIAEASKKLEAAIKEGDSLILFPEGTTSDSCRVLPFGSSFFNVPMKLDVPVQPMTISYERWDGVPMSHYMKKMIGWASPTLELAPHLWFLCQLGRVNVTVRMHEVLYPKDFSSRKELAERAWELVNNGRYESIETSEYDVEEIKVA